MSDLKHPCDCCGHCTLDEPSGRTGQICPVCFWEDSRDPELDSSGWNGSNGLDLEEAQSHFQEAGVCSPDFVQHVREPTANEPRDPAWQTVRNQRAASAKTLGKLVHSAFAPIKRTEGVLLRTLYRGDVDDDTRDLALCGGINEIRRWQNLSGAILADPQLESAHGQFDPVSYRFHLPAYLTCWLSGDDLRSESIVFNAFIWGWQEMHRGDDRCRLELLDAAQRYVVARFLGHLVRFEAEYRDDARKPLKKGWQTVLDAGPPDSSA